MTQYGATQVRAPFESVVLEEENGIPPTLPAQVMFRPYLSSLASLTKPRALPSQLPHLLLFLSLSLSLTHTHSLSLSLSWFQHSQVFVDRNRVLYLSTALDGKASSQMLYWPSSESVQNISLFLNNWNNFTTTQYQ